MQQTQCEITVSEMVDLLAELDPGAVVRLAINPFFPMSHAFGGVIETVDADGTPIVYLAESAEAEQPGYLPPAVAVALEWQEPTAAPPHRRRGTAAPNSSQ